MPSPVRRKPLAVTSLVLALAFALVDTALAGNGGVAPPEPASPTAESIRDVYWLLLGVAAVIFVLVEAALILFIVKYRGGSRPRHEEGPQVIGHHRLELIWTAVPVLILVVIGAFVFYKLPGIDDVPEATAQGSKVQIQVEGRQFYWRYVYPNGAVSIDELRLPVGTPVELRITAPDYDVAHSWWVPSLAGKMDAIPGNPNQLSFVTPGDPGVFVGQCAEFCGVQHAMMLTRVRVVPQTEYRSYLSSQLQVNADVGRMTFLGACAPCHGDKGEGMIGPALQGNATLADRQRLRDLLEHGKRKMPPVGQGWSQHELDALVAYVSKEFAGGG